MIPNKISLLPSYIVGFILYGIITLSNSLVHQHVATCLRKMNNFATHSKIKASDGENIDLKLSELLLTSIKDVCDLSDAFLIDAWGVLHNGSTLYPRVLECLEGIASQNKPVIILSNSSRKEDEVRDHLSKLGLSKELYSHIVTSGDVAWQELRAGQIEPFSSLGKRCLVLGNGDDDVEYIQSAGLTLEDIDQCNFILARGSFSLLGQTTKIVDKSGILELPSVKAVFDIALKKRIPLLVTNPDFMRPGTNDPMPGLIGQNFEASGGVVHWVGKPYPLVYQICAGKLNTRNLCAIGDSLDHDIKGAIGAGIKSIWIMSGVHSTELGIDQGSDVISSKANITSVISNRISDGKLPTYVIPILKW